MNLTKLALKRPVSAILIILALTVFGITSIMSFKMQLIPDMDMPMLLVMTAYPGADPESVEELVTEVIEDSGSTLNGVDSVTSSSAENISIVMFQYEYGIDIDECYSDLRAALDTASLSMPADAIAPVIMEISMDAGNDITISASGDGGLDLLKVINDALVPEIETISDVAQVEVSGGRERYIKIQLNETMLEQYGLTMASVTNYLAAVDFTMPAGSVTQGDQDVSVSTAMEYNTIQMLKEVPVITAAGSVIHMSDIADIFHTDREAESISRRNGHENITIGIQKKQSAGAVSVSDTVMEVLAQFEKENPSVHFEVEYNSSDTIVSALSSVGKTLAAGVLLSMLVLFLFFGDFRASLIVGSSMPISLFATLILMKQIGFSLNLMTTGALVIAIGMMVDSSIVVIESCFRAKDEEKSYFNASLVGAGRVTASIIASTITTVVVYLPLSTMSDLSGQMFSQLGYTIVFAMIASLIAAMMLVPLFFNLFKPIEKKNLLINRLLAGVIRWYRAALRFLLDKKLAVIASTILLTAAAVFVATFLHFELMPAADEGVVAVNATFRPGTTLEARDREMQKLEELADMESDVENYSLTISGEDSATLRAYLKTDRKYSTAQIVEKWYQETLDYTDMELEIASGGSTAASGMMTSNAEVDLQGTDMEELKAAARLAKEEMERADGVIKVLSSASDTATIAKIKVDPMMAMHYGLTPAGVASSVNHILSGVKALTITNHGTESEVWLEYPDGLYDSMNSLMDVTITGGQGVRVPLRDLAEVVYTDGQQSITRVDGLYQIALTAVLTEETKYTGQNMLTELVQNMALPGNIKVAENQMTAMMNEELLALFQAILTAIFLVFLVMAMQFESPRFSFMVMMCIPFSLIGSFFLLFITGSTLSMVSMMGFLMLMGIVVNNGILYVDTTNQLRLDMPVREALIETGTIRLRPILMTTLTTILSMLPMGMGIGENAQMMQGMALVIIGGLVTSTVLTLVLIPTIYLIIDKKYDMDGKSRRRKLTEIIAEQDEVEEEEE